MLTQKALEYLQLGTGGSYSLARDAISDRLWDTRSFSSTAQSYTFFAQPVGSQWIGGTAKTLNETNLYTTASLPNGQTFLINKFGIAVILNPLHLSAGANIEAEMGLTMAMTKIIQNSVFDIRIAGREYDFQAHGRQLMSMPLASTAGNGTAFNVAPGAANYNRVGDYISSGWIKLDPTPIFLDQLVSFQVNQRLDNPIPGIKTALDDYSAVLSMYNATLMVILEGFRTRAK